jgi:hypothetical protein
MSFRTSCLLAAALALPPASLAAAQEGTGARISPDRPRAAAPRVEAAPRAEPPSGLAESIDDPGTLLRLAQATLASGRFGEAAELVERAEARLLTRSELASQAEQPASGGAFRDIAAARAALSRRDRVEADAMIGAALAGLDRREPPSDTGPPEALPPLSGGGPVRVEPPPGALLGPPTLPPPRPRM